MKKENVAILFGGCSSEYGVSLQSASSVIQNLDSSKYNPILVGITRQGHWYLFEGDVRKIAEDTWMNDSASVPVALSLNRNQANLLAFCGDKVKKYDLDVAFPVLHGQNGEDGTVQGLLELAGVPYVGCGVLASALCMDKDRAHKIAAAAGVAVPASHVLPKGTDSALVHQKAGEIGYPLFVKPVKAGSSYGISKIDGPDLLDQAVEEALRYDDVFLLEESIPGFECGCALMGNAKLLHGEVDEVELEGGFFDFVEKYNLITSRIHVPARIAPEKREELVQTAKQIYRALGCSGFARVDLFLTPQGRIYFNEVNTIPGFTEHSRFPNMMKAKGLSFTQLLTLAIELAVTPC